MTKILKSLKFKLFPFLKWIPELKDVPNKEIHEWEKHYHKYNLKELNYFKPIVEYKTGRENSIKTYKQIT